MSAVVSTTCSRCGADLRDRTSRMFGIGPECRKTMTATQLRVTNAAARRTAQPVTDRDLCPCDSGAVKGRCPTCRVPANPSDFLAEAVARTIAKIRAQRAAERDAAYEAWNASHPAITDQGEPGGTE